MKCVNHLTIFVVVARADRTGTKYFISYAFSYNFRNRFQNKNCGAEGKENQAPNLGYSRSVRILTR